jgi:hypothetical protein
MIRSGAPARPGCRWPTLAILAFALAALPGQDSRASTDMYVIEQLVLGVSSTPGGSERVGTIKSGDRVEVLERQGDEAHIQLANGSSGWVKASYLSSDPPLQRRLQDRTTEVEKLRQDISRLESQLAARPARAAPGTAAAPASAPAPPATSSSAPPVTSGSPSQAAVRDPSPFMSSQDLMGQPTWVWVLSCSAAALAFGFLAGWRMLDRRIRRKYGGLRIY